MPDLHVADAQPVCMLYLDGLALSPLHNALSTHPHLNAHAQSSESASGAVKHA